MQRIGLYGGSFDPVHLGHLLVAQAAREELRLDRLFFIPAAQSPFKPDSQPTPGAERLRLLRLALAGKTWCEIDEQEIQRGGVSYTIDTRARLPRAISGGENFSISSAAITCRSCRRGARPEELARLAEFVVVPRPGQAEMPFPKPFRGQRAERLSARRLVLANPRAGQGRPAD